MPFRLFHELYPEIAEKETRTITVLQDSDVGVPPGEYGFLEMFCNEPGCDCRRVFFMVMTPAIKGPAAIVAWGWEDRDFYRRWMKGPADDSDLDELTGPVLNFGSPETYLSEAILDLTRKVLLRDTAFVERVKRHYAMFREKIERKSTTAGGRASRGSRRRRR